MNTLTYSQAVTRLTQMARSGADRLLVALAGCPGAGKSTVAQQLTADVNRRIPSHWQAVVALGMDGFHLPKAVLREMPNPEEAFARRGSPWTFDPAGLSEHLHQVRRSAGIVWSAWPDFQHGTGDPVERRNAVPPQTRVVLVEGLYLLHREGPWAEVCAAFDERWFLDTPLDVSLQRLARRHMDSWKVSAEEAAARIARNDRLNADIVLATRAHADWLLRAEE